MSSFAANILRERQSQPIFSGWFVFTIFIGITLALCIFFLKDSNPNDLLKLTSIFSAQNSNSKHLNESGNNAFTKEDNLIPNELTAQSFDEATRELISQIEKNPTNPQLQNSLGLIYMNLDDSNSAEKCFKNAINLCHESIEEIKSKNAILSSEIKFANNSDKVIKLTQLSLDLSAAHSNLARLYDQKGDRERVIFELNELNKDSSLLLADSNTHKAQSQGFNGQPALSKYDEKLMNLADAQCKSGQFNKALATYADVLQRKPDCLDALDKTAMIKVMQGDLSQAVESWETALKFEPNSAIMNNNLGLTYRNLGRANEAEDSFKKAIHINPALEEASLNLSDMFASKGEMSEAIKILKELTKNNPNSARAQNNLATLLSLKGDYAEAINIFHKAIKLNPRMASAHYGIGIALIQSKSYAPAINELRQAIAINPNMHEAQIKIDEATRLQARSSGG